MASGSSEKDSPSSLSVTPTASTMTKRSLSVASGVTELNSV